MNPIKSILRETIRNCEDLTNPPIYNILTGNAHERTECGIARTGHNFYAIQGEGLKTWDDRYEKMPTNYTNLDGTNLPLGVGFDLAISHHRSGMHQALASICGKLNIPLIAIEHCVPMPTLSPAHKAQFRSLKGEANVFIHKWQGLEWGWTEGSFTVIEHGVDTQQFAPGSEERKRVIGACVNDWANRGAILGFDMWREATNGLPIEVLGASPGYSEPAKNIQDLADHYKSWQIFCNTSIYSTYPTVCLEAAASECAIVTTSTCALSDIFVDGETALIANDSRSMKKALTHLLDKPEECQRLGKNARKMIMERFSMERFLKDWNSLMANTLESWRP